MAKTPVSGQQRILARMRRVREGLPGIMQSEEIVQFLSARLRRNFDKGVDPDGKPWKPLAASTIERKKKAGNPYPNRPLYATGLMRRSISVIVGRADGIFAVNTGLGLRIGVDSEEASQYARIHNYGGMAGNPPHKIPMRKFLALGAKDVVAVQGYVRRRIKKLVDDEV